MLAVFIYLASADDGTYRPEHHGGDYSHQSGAYHHTGGAYHHTGGAYHHISAPAPVVRVVPQVIRTVVPVAPAGPQGHWQILRDIRDQSPAGDYHYEFETQNGIHAREQSQVVVPQSQKTTGFYEYKSPEGQNVRVDYVADENGFQPVGSVLPQAPPVPAAIQRAVEYLLRNARP